MTHTGASFPAPSPGTINRISYVAGAKPERLIDEVDLALDPVSVDEHDDASIGRVIVHARQLHPCPQQAGGALNGAGASLEVDVLARKRSKCRDLARALS